MASPAASCVKVKITHYRLRPLRFDQWEKRWKSIYTPIFMA